MIAIKDYSIEQYTKKNQIIINLPQTFETISNTISPVSTTRRTELDDSELAALLTMAIKCFESH